MQLTQRSAFWNPDQVFLVNITTGRADALVNAAKFSSSFHAEGLRPPFVKR